LAAKTMRRLTELATSAPWVAADHVQAEVQGGASILMFEPTGTPTAGDRHEEIPAHVDATTGHEIYEI
jgi:hypothetical protein